MYIRSHLTCWFSASEGEGRSAALLDRFVASVQVDAVYSEWLQALNFTARLVQLSLTKVLQMWFTG